MNIFMSFVLKMHVTIPAGTTLPNGHIMTKSLLGCPAGFAITALQQVVTFILFFVYSAAVYNTVYRHDLKKLTTVSEYVNVVIFGAVFAANIALNNFSLGYISVGVNLIIRSCLPLSTYCSQQALSLFGIYKWKEVKILEILLMVVGVICAFVFTLSHFEGKIVVGGGAFQGVVACVGSLLCGSL